MKPEDLQKFGLIPEFIGRLPVTVTLDLLDKEALMSILTEPKNALTKQYQALMEMDEVKLTFTKEALSLIADEALNRKTGARGLRSVIEEKMNDLMFRLPSEDGVGSCIITEEFIRGEKDAELVPRKSTNVSEKEDKAESAES